jgi:hypothetical protein|tara:strand:+ start:791 stop:1090 length:300 start_codon:yes stop_codon:yes gene_type:complete
MITAILTLIDLIGTSDYTDYIVHTTMVGTTLIGDGIEDGETTIFILTICTIVLLFLLAHLLDRKYSRPKVNQLEFKSMVEEEKKIMEMESTKMEEDMKN